MNRPLRLAECSLPYICVINEYCGMFVAIYLRYPFRYFYLLYPTFCHVHPVGVGADSSCSYPRNSTKWRCIFASLILQFIVSYPRNCIKWRCNSHHFDISKPFGLDCKTGAMNRPLRLAVCSLPYICAINEYCGMFVAIHLRYPFRYFYLLYPTFCHVHPVGVGADLSCPYPRNSTKWRCIFALLILQCCYFYLLCPTFCPVHPVGVGSDLSCPYPRTPTKWRCVFPSLALQYIIPYPRNCTKWRCNFPPLALQFIVPYPRTPTKWVAICNISYIKTDKKKREVNP